jgi:2'-5' RNA ligase
LEEEKNIRSFIALDIGKDVRANLDKLQARLKSCPAEVKWVRAGAIHCTLRFLGSISPDKIGLAHQAMIEACSGQTSFLVEVRGLGMFPNPRRPRVIWAGLEGGKEQLAGLFQALEKSLVARGFGPADRPFQPHLTLGRVKSPRGIDALLKIMEPEQGKLYGTFQAERLTLFKSQLHPGGAIYSVLQETPFLR